MSKSFQAAAAALTLFLSVPANAQNYATIGGPLPSTLIIPDGTGSTCWATPGAAVAADVSVGTGLPAITALRVSVTLSHTWYGDVGLTVSHSGVSVALMQGVASDCGDSSPLSGTYVFADSAAQTIDAAATAAGTSTVPAGTYQGDNPLSPFLGLDPSGTWTMAFQDGTNLDTGTVTAVAVEFACGTSPFFTVGQVFGTGAPFVINHQCGVPGAIYLSTATQGTANAPYGWFFGADIPTQLILDQTWSGPPFWGLLDGDGDYSAADTTLLTNYGPGYTLTAVGVHVNAAGTTVTWFTPAPITVTLQ